MKRTLTHLTSLILVAILTLVSCEKEIDLGLEIETRSLVVEGYIEQGQPPIVLLTESRGYFEELDFAALSEMWVHDATVTVSNGTNTVNLVELCAADIPAPLIPIIEDFLGVPVSELAAIGYCVYTSLDPSIWGEVGKNYTLRIETGGEIYEGVTQIPQLVPLDTTWFEVFGDEDTLGFAWAQLSDPDTLGNAYRWYAKRINQYKYGDLAGEQKDDLFIAPLGSAFNDEFFNGLSFELVYDRGESPNLEDYEVDGFFKVGDTVAVKFCTIDNKVYDFLRMSDTQAFSQGNPFAVPANIPSNMSNGALGIWAGYGVTYDTLVAY